MSVHCAEVLSAAPGRTAKHESGDPSGGGRIAGVKVVLISEKPDGFSLERFSEGGAFAGATQHETMDDAMRQAYSEYDISAWRSCPDGVDPLEYIRGRSES
jgi:hypothetical protein